MKNLVAAGAVALLATAFAACDQQPPPVPAASPVSVQHEPDSYGDPASEEGEECECTDAGQLVHSSGF